MISFEDVAGIEDNTNAVLEHIAGLIFTAKRDRKRLADIVRNYGIGNDAGMSDTISHATAKRVKEIAKSI